MLGLFSVLGQGEGQGKRADTTDVHVADKDDLGGVIPTGWRTGGEATGRECRRGLEDGVVQRNVRLDQRDEETRHQNEAEGHQDDGIGAADQRRGYGTMLILDVFFALDGGQHRLDEHEQRGGFHTARRGTRRTTDEDDQGDHYHCRQCHIVDIQDHKTGSPASDDLEERCENLVKQGCLTAKSVVFFDEEKQHRADEDNGSSRGQDDLGLWH